MPLPLPTLDRLEFDELVTDGLAELPGLAPGWTDYNAHDPGITLLELLAWLIESHSYRLNRIPESAYRAFLRLADAEPRAARVAETALVFAPGARSEDLVRGTRVANADDSVEFQTLAALHVSKAKLTVVASGHATALDVLSSSEESTLFPLGMEPRVDDALYLGFDAPLADEGTEISVGVFTGREAADAETREQLQAEARGWQYDRPAWCGGSESPDLASWNAHYGARTAWEFRVADGWRPLQDVVDDTRALTLSGIVRFKAPAPAAHAAGALGTTGNPATRFIRCRLVQGAYDCPPRIAGVAINVVPARHAVDVGPEPFTSDGRAGQQFALEFSPVVPDSTTITIAPKGRTAETWKEVRSFDAIGPHARAYVLIPETGTIVFGNGRQGRVPSAEAAITVRYASGGGPGGNVHTLSRTIGVEAPVVVSQPYEAHGGAPAETPGAAKARAARQLAAPSRAVTLDDYESLALATPGVPVARTHAIADYHPRLGRVHVSGSVTVVALPWCPARRPEPTASMCLAVHRYLDRRRVLASELHVVGPCYTTISVTARLHVGADADRRDVARRAREALLRFFHPLRGGTDGKGYPIGRAAFRSEVLAVLDDVPGVSYVAELSWRIGDSESSTCGAAEICRHGLLVSGSHQITVDPGSACRD